MSVQFFVPSRITVETYDDIVKSIKEKQAENIDQQRLHSKADETFYLTASRILDLANRATELFESSEAEEKRQLLQFVLQKTELKGKKLEFTMKKPFDILLESAKTKDWLPSPEILIRITQAIITVFSDSVSFESTKNKWIEIKKIPDYSSPATLVIAS